MTDKELAKSLSVCQGRGRRARAALDVPARECRIARHYVWACLPRSLSLLPSTEVQCAEACVRADGGNKVAAILLAKLLDGHLASFVRSEGDFFIVSVNGQERTISRDAWRLLPEQETGAQDRVHHLHHHRGHREQDD